MGIEIRAEKKNTDMTSPILCSEIDMERMRIGSTGETNCAPNIPTEDTSKMDKRVESSLGIADDFNRMPIYFNSN